MRVIRRWSADILGTLGLATLALGLFASLSETNAQTGGDFCYTCPCLAPDAGLCDDNIGNACGPGSGCGCNAFTGCHSPWPNG
jgi:hypothetical protein